jgi:hypothetical protein
MPRVLNDIIIDQSNVTTTDITSEVIDTTNVYGASIHVISTGTIAGTVEFQVSNDMVNWVALASPTVTVTNATNAVAQTPELFYKWLRIVHQATSGTTNTLKVHLTCKGI